MTRNPHDVPLSRQALEVLRETWPHSEGGDLVFPSVTSLSKPLSENAFNASLRRLGFGPGTLRRMIRPMVWREGALCLLDQRLLPGQEVWLELTTSEDVAQAIREMAVRGAPAIGIAAAYGMVTLRHDGFRKVREALTSLDEVIQICGDIGESFERKAAASVEALTARD